MGGERETVVEKTDKKGDSIKDLGGLRIHENNHEVHFHDDKAKLKAAVPVSVWWRAWDKLRCEPGTWNYVDSKFNSHLTVETRVEDGTLEVYVALASAKVGKNFAKLNDFTKKK